MSKKLLDKSHCLSVDDFSGFSFAEAIEFLKEMEKELIEEGGFNFEFNGCTYYESGYDFSINYQQYESDKEYEQRLKSEFDETEKNKIKKIQAEYGKNYILLKDEEFTWEDKAFKVEYVDENTFNGLLDSLKKSDK